MARPICPKCRGDVWHVGYQQRTCDNCGNVVPVVKRAARAVGTFAADVQDMDRKGALALADRVAREANLTAAQRVSLTNALVSAHGKGNGGNVDLKIAVEPIYAGSISVVLKDVADVAHRDKPGRFYVEQRIHLSIGPRGALTALGDDSADAKRHPLIYGWDYVGKTRG